MTIDIEQGEGEPMDLTPLDPCADRARFERRVGGVVRAAATELARRRAGASVWGVFAQWRRPVLAVSGVLAVVSLLILMRAQPAVSTRTSLAEAAGVPTEWARWVQAGRNPSPADLIGVERSER